MAKQKGLIKIEGTVGDMTYYKSKDGYLAKEKTSLNGTRILTDPKFQRTRENMAEFGNAGKAGKLVRRSINTVLKNAKDGKVVSRLTKALVHIVRTDTTAKRGDRTVANGNLSLLNGFNFNNAAILTATLYAPFTTVVDRVAGSLTVNIPSFVPDAAVIVPEGATHFRLVSAGAELDFDNEVFVSDIQQPKLVAWDENPTGDISITNTVTAASKLPLFLFLGIQFYQEVNGFQYPLKDSSFNALSLVAVSMPS